MFTKKEKKLRPYFYLLLVLLPLLFIQKGRIELFINKYHTPFLDEFFKLASSLANGTGIAICGLLVLFFMKKKWIYKFLLGTVIHFVFVHVFKQLLLKHMQRPVSFFSKEIVNHLNFVDGIRVHHLGSFPSGHTTTIFFLVSFFSLCLTKKRKGITYALAITGLIAGISRMYLLQHFFMDVYFGIIFGVLSTLTAHRIIKKSKKISLENRLFPTVYSSLREQLFSFRNL